MRLPKHMIGEQIKSISGIGTFVFAVIIVLLVILTKQFTLTLTLILSLLSITIIGGFIKFFFFKSRPDKQKFKTWIEKIDAGSFPSIHAARAMCFLVIFGLYFNSVYWWMFLGILALFIGLSRIILKRHRLVDVIAGYIFGFIVGFVIYNLII